MQFVTVVHTHTLQMLTNIFPPRRINPWSIKGILWPENEALQYVKHYTPGSRGKLRDGLDDSRTCFHLGHRETKL